MADSRKVVWVLGAGFSRSLGGPLLQALLTPSSGTDIKLRFPDAPKLHDSSASFVRRVYEYGRKHADGATFAVDAQKRTELLWSHAEEFLDYLDTAAMTPSGPRSRRIIAIAQNLSGGGVSPPAITHLGQSARRLIAAECCAFLEDADPSSERWQPYHDWAAKLDESNTLVSFNYDRVLELLDGDRIEVRPPGVEWNKPEICRRARAIKLHGSVDWKKVRGDGDSCTFSATEDRAYAVSCEEDDLAIATPGPSKARGTKELNEHWDLACARLMDADAIVFVGFRFPPSDSIARSKLLTAIRNNPKEGALHLHVVLGPPPSNDAARLEGLLSAACEQAGRFRGGASGRFYSLRVHPLFAEDFLSIYYKAMLFR